MKNNETLKLTPSGEREIVMTRIFDASRELIFDAYTRPELIKRWLLGPPGWTMPVCEVDLRVGGAYRFVWRKENEPEMGMGGVYREVIRPEKFVNTEKFDEAWYPGEALLTTILTEKNGKTIFTTTMLYESREAREAVLSSDMQSGLAASYDRLDGLLASMKTQAYETHSTGGI